MNDNRTDQLGAAASDALQRGDLARAASLFEQFTAAAPNDRRGWLGLAMAQRDLGDLEAAHAALDGLLKRNWMDLPGLMMKGDLYAQRGDEKAAATFYNLVWSRSPAIASLTPDAAAQVQRAKAYCDAHSAALLRSVEAELMRAGYEKGRTSRRFSESIEILAGTARRYVEEPVGFFFAGLPATGFYPEADAIQQKTP
jgi:tetratricopeptide (TPR) repeat protein